MQQPAYGPIFFVIRRPECAVYFDVRDGSWHRSITAVQGFRSREFAVGAALEWCLEGQVEVAGYRLAYGQHRPEPVSTDEEQAHGEQPY